MVYDGAGRVVFDPDRHVQEAIYAPRQTYSRTGAIRAAVKHFRRQGLLFPTRLHSGPRKGELVWRALSEGRVSTMLHNPWYADAYALGRSRWRKQLDGIVRREPSPRDEWIALIRDAHPAYISWEDYMRNEEQLRVA